MENEYEATTLINQTLGSQIPIYISTSYSLPFTSLIFLDRSPIYHEFLEIQLHANKQAYIILVELVACGGSDPIELDLLLPI